MRSSVPARRVVRTVMGADLRRLMRDRVGLLFVAVMPFVLILAIGTFVPSDDVDVVLAVVDSDGGPAARQLTERVDDTSGFEIVQGINRREAERDLMIGQVSAVLAFPEGFSDDVASDGGGVEVVVNPRAAGSALVISEVASAIDREAMQVTVEKQLADAGAADPESGAEQATGSIESSEVAVRAVDSESGGSNLTFVAAGQMILFMFMNSLGSAMGFIELRRLGILDRVRAGPASGRDVLLGLGIARFGVVILLAVAIAAMAVVLYDVDWGPLGVFAAVVPLFALISAAASALLGASVDAPESAIGLGVPIGLAMAALGGCMFPIFFAPDAFQVASKVLTPHAWALDAILGAAYDGETIGDVTTNLTVLALWALGFTAAAVMVLRRRTG